MTRQTGSEDRVAINRHHWHWPDARGWIGIGVFSISVMLLWMMKIDGDLRSDEFFQTIATVIISNGLMAVIAWAYSATKGGGELADKNALIAERVTAKAIPDVVPTDEPQKVKVVNKEDEPVPTETAEAGDEKLPDYAR